MKCKGFTWIEALIVIGTIGVLAAILFPVFMRASENDKYGKARACRSNLKNIMLGFKQYIQDNDEKYPTVISTGATFGWADAISDYARSNQSFQCAIEGNYPNQPDQPNPREVGFTDYWYNRNLSGVKEDKIHNVNSLILLGEGNDGTDQTDARYSLSTPPAKWIGDTSSPLYRHKYGANYAFLDGHVIKIPAAWIQSPNKGYPTFRIQ